MQPTHLFRSTMVMDISTNSLPAKPQRRDRPLMRLFLLSFLPLFIKMQREKSPPAPSRSFRFSLKSQSSIGVCVCPVTTSPHPPQHSLRTIGSVDGIGPQALLSSPQRPLPLTHTHTPFTQQPHPLPPPPPPPSRPPVSLLASSLTPRRSLDHQQPIR